MSYVLVVLFNELEQRKQQWPSGANEKTNDEIDSIESMKFRSKSQKIIKLILIESTKFRSKSHTQN